MKIEEIIDSKRETADIIADLKKKAVKVPLWSELVKEYDPRKHEIVVNKRLRPDKKLKNGGREPVARVTYGMQRLSVRRMTQMCMSIPVKRIYNIENDPLRQVVAKAIEEIYKHVHIDNVNNKRMRAYFAACEVLTVWYTVKEKNKLYGFESEYKLKCRSYSPMDKKFSRIEEAALYPLMDSMGDMVAMSFSYLQAEKDGDVEYFETYTNMNHFVWAYREGKWEDVIVPEEIVIEKMPLIYIWRPLSIWEDSTNNTQEIEFTLSRESDILRKNSAPVLKVKGKLINNEQPETDVAREVYQLEGDGDIEYATWEQQIEAMKFYIETLKQNIEEELQLPNLSLENVKGLSAISGEARKTLLTDAHLKVGDESGDIMEFLEREFNVIKAFLKMMNRKWESTLDELKAEHVITPFVQNDEGLEIDRITKATQKPIMSQKTGIKRLGLVDNVDEEYKQLQDESSKDMMGSVFEPTV